MQIDPKLAQVALEKARVAKENIDTAEAELKAANKTLKDAIPNGDVAELRRAHGGTEKAEKAVSKASQKLEVVEIALDEARANTTQPLPST